MTRSLKALTSGVRTSTLLMGGLVPLAGILIAATPALAETAEPVVYSTNGAAQTTVALLLAVLFGLLIVEACHKTLAAALVVGAMLVISAASPLTIMNFDDAVRAVDWNVIFLLGSMMAIVSVLVETRVFDWLNSRMVRWAGGRPTLLANIVITVTGFLSAFADNVTTVLFMAPVVSKAARSLRLSVWALAMPMIMAANIGGTATLIGDPPNVIVGVASGLSFMNFIEFLAVPIIVMMVALCAFAAFWYRRDLAGAHADAAAEEEAVELADPAVLAWTLGVVALTFVGFFTHSVTHLPVGVVAFVGAGLTMAGRHAILSRSMSAKKADHVFTHSFERGIEWLTLGFFIFLFMAISAAEHTGLIASAAERLQDLIAVVSVGLGLGLKAKLLTAALLILVFSAVVSAVVDNIPYTIAAVAIVRVLISAFSGEMATAGVPAQDIPLMSDVLWWSLALGACLGGNGTLIGASANVTTVGLLEKDGHHMSFVEFLSFGVPVMAMTVAIAAVYLACYVYVGAVETNVIGAAGLAVLAVVAASRAMLRRAPAPDVAGEATNGGI